MKERTKQNITHTVKWGDITFWFIEDEVPLSSLKYSLGRLIAQNYEKNNLNYSTAEDELVVEEYKGGFVELPRVFRDITDMESFFIMFD